MSPRSTGQTGATPRTSTRPTHLTAARTASGLISAADATAMADDHPTDGNHQPAQQPESSWDDAAHGTDAGDPDLRTPIAGLVAYHRNPRRGDVDAIADSLTTNGQYRPVTVNRGTHTGRPMEVLAGNHTVAAARQLGWASIAAVFVDVDDTEARRIVLADNRTADLAAYDTPLLTGLLSELEGTYDGTGWEPDAAGALLDTALYDRSAATGQLPADADDTPDPPATPRTQPGDLWLLGRHRLLCGDALDGRAHDTLLDGTRPTVIYTDPPYGMNLQTDYTRVGHGQGKKHRPVIGDDRPFNPTPLLARYNDVREQFWWGADYYRAVLPSGGSWIVWDKRSNDDGMDLDRLFGAAFELCWSRQVHKREIARVLWAMSHGTHALAEDSRRGLHPTQKPVSLAAWFLDRFSDRGAIVADFFAGSGTTMAACERMARTALLMELDPAYCDVIARRYQELAGELPVLTRTGQPVDFTVQPTPTIGSR